VPSCRSRSKRRRAWSPAATIRARDAVNRNRALLSQAAQTENQVQIQLAAKRSHVAALNQAAHDLQAAREQLVHDRAARAEDAESAEAPLTERQVQAEAAKAAN